MIAYGIRILDWPTSTTEAFDTSRSGCPGHKGHVVRYPRWQHFHLLFG